MDTKVARGCGLVVDVAPVMQGNQHMDVEQGPHQMPSVSRKRSINSLLTTPPRAGSGWMPYAAKHSDTLGWGTSPEGR